MSAPVDIQALVAAVTEEVMARLGTGGKRRQRRTWLLLPLPSRQIPALSRWTEERIREGHPVTVLAGAGVLEELERSGLHIPFGRPAALEAAVSGALLSMQPGDGLILGSLGFELARRLRSLQDETPAVRLVTQALLRNAPAWALVDDLAGEAAGPLSAEGDRLVRELSGMGLRTLRLDALQAEWRQLQEDTASVNRTIGTLLTEVDVDRLAAAGERRVVLARRALVTPLAASRAAALGLEVVRTEGG
jgi:hypothetical protein